MIKLKRHWQIVLLVVVTVILAVTLFFFVRKIEYLKLQGYIRPRHFRGQATGQSIPPEQIRGWMTFRYINMLFKLPPAYLQTSLNISDKRYPNVTIDSFASSQKIDKAQLLELVVKAVQNQNKK